MTAHSAFPGYQWGYDPAKGADKSAFTLMHETRFGVEIDAVVYGQTADLFHAAFQALCAVQERRPPMSDATNPAVVQDAQRYGHDEAMADIFDLAHIETEFQGNNPRVTGLAAYIERLEAERDALLAEHEAVGMAASEGLLHYATVMKLTHDNAERVIHSE